MSRQNSIQRRRERSPSAADPQRLVSGARQLPLHHVTIRVPWHDSGWNGAVCRRPLDNTSCLALPRIGGSRQDAAEVGCAGARFDQLSRDALPPCAAERGSFMAPFPLDRVMTHPYAASSKETHGHFAPTTFQQPPFSAACVPFRWMLRKNVEGSKEEVGLAERLKLDWVAEREPKLSFETSWVQDRDNQLALLDTFFGALRPEESLCFFYAKQTPLSEQSRRVIIGVGRVLSVGRHVEYQYTVDNPPVRCVLWERNVGHSIRDGYVDGFLFPYGEILAKVDAGELADPEPFVAFAPDEHFEQYSYGSELLPHDGAVASLVACAAALNRIRDIVEGPWDAALRWVDAQLNRLWQARGAFPGLGSALSAFGYEWGFQHGTLLAYELELARERAGGQHNPWTQVEAVMKDPSHLGGPVATLLTAGLRKGWASLPKPKRQLLDLLSRCAIGEAQALRMYDATERRDAGIAASDAELLQNPYSLFELDRRSFEPISFGAVDRGLFPDEAIRQAHPIAALSRIDDPADPRRVRALTVDILEQAAREQGHTVLPRSWVIERARARSLRPPCPLGDNVLDAAEATFKPMLDRLATRSGEVAYQVDRLAQCRAIIQSEVRRRKRGKPHAGEHVWRELVDDGLKAALPHDEEEREVEQRARDEKASALETLYRGRLSVLIGPAGTGKTTLLRMLCDMPDVKSRGVLLLAPTGKARVRLEAQTGQRGAGRTLAQFLTHHKRFDWETGAYYPDRSAPKCSDYRTVIVDECSMLTEEQLAALIDALSNVERLVLVGDPRQLPPIGAGRPFVDIVKDLAPDGVESVFPRCGPSYAELTIPRRQTGAARDDVLLAAHFSGRPLDPGADEVWDRAVAGEIPQLRLVQWSDPRDLQAKVIGELVRALGLDGPDDELRFEVTLGGAPYKDLPWAFFWNRFADNPGAASNAEAWQILSPVRSGPQGVDSMNRLVQAQFRKQVRALADAEGWTRKVPKPVGPQAILYGDKVINLMNHRRRNVWPKPEGEPYLANGDIGIVVGEYKTKKLRSLPRKLEVEFVGQLGSKYGFWPGEFGDDGDSPLELAYCLTVHKTQGSEFGTTLVVLPNPCWLLSRELLYTALTRHEDQLVILHQGPFTDFRRFAGEDHSDIARRMTNLFADPMPREVVVGTERRFLEDGLIHRTERGDLVRSKSELVIADKLFARGVEYAYEQPLTLPSGQVRYPDFTIEDHAAGITYFWEHLGLLENPEYRARWERKLAAYRSAGILPIEEGGGDRGTLVVTRDDAAGGLDAALIARLVDELAG